jgi:transposase-like protein
MAQLHFTLDYEFFVGLMSDSKDEAFGKLMKALLDQVLMAESKEQLGAGEYERSDQRMDYRNGTRERSMGLRIGKITLAVPRHRNVPFKTALFETYQRNEQALISAMMEMVVQGVSTRKISKVTEELCGMSFSKSMVSEICKEMDVALTDFRERRLDKKYPFVLVDAMYIKVRQDGKVRSRGILWAMGINLQGRKELLGIKLCEEETKESWISFFHSLKARGLANVDVITSDAHSGLVPAIKECFEGSTWQRCQFHFHRNILDKAPKKYQMAIAEQVREMFETSSIEAARRMRDEIIKEYEDVAKSAMTVLDDGFEDAMAVMALPSKYRKVLRTTNLVERENKEIRRREKVISIFPNEESAVRLITAVLMDRHETWQSRSRTFDMQQYLENRIIIRRNMAEQRLVA